MPVDELQPRMLTRRGRREPDPLDQLPVWLEDPARTEVDGQPDDGAGSAGLRSLLGGLNRDQRRAVTHGAGPLLVVAGAGTGKTQVITRRIAWLIASRRAKPSEILALTFTDKAADEMAARVDQLVPYGYTDTRISTFHAFGDRIIREFALELGLPTDVRVLSRPEVVIFLREHLFDLPLHEYRPLGDPTRFLAALASLFSRCKDEDVSPVDYLSFAARLEADARAAVDAVGATGEEATEGEEATDSERDAADAMAEDARRQTELAGAYARYQELLAAAGCIDFGDQVSLALRLLRQSPAARAVLQERFRYILVDEFQDTNRAQAELVALLAERHRNVTVVGDDDQAIYAFRGAAVGNILDFERRYRGCRTVVLRRNYRSFRPILDAAYRLIRFNDPDRLEVRSGVVKRLIPARAAPRLAPVLVETFATGSDEADWVAAEIGRRIGAGARPRDHAILVRANAAADAFLRSLNLAGIPWRFSGSSGLYARPEIRLLLAFLRTVADPHSTVDLYALATSSGYGLGGPDLTALVNNARRRNRSLWEVLEELERQPGILRLTAGTRATITKLLRDLRGYVALAHERPAGEVLYAFLKGSGLLARLAAGASVAEEEQLSNIARFFDVIRSQSAILPDDRVVFVARHLATLIEAGDDPATADLDPDSDAVAVLTVHKAKGLEFTTVFLVGLVDGRFPARDRREPLALPDGLVKQPPPEGDVTLEEERRLCYVGMTRARDELVLTHAADYGGGRARRVSPFVLEALDRPAGTGIAGGAANPLEKLAAFDAVAPSVDAEVEPIEGPLTLSYYAIDDYLTCPLKYKYAHVLRVPLAPHHAIVYGSALHQAVQEFHRRQARGQPMSEEELFGAFERAWSNEGFVSREHEEARLDAGRRALCRFREEQLGPAAVVPAYVEREFAFTLEGDRVRGRWDRVDIEPGEPDATPVPDAIVQADVVSPTLPMGARERVTITDYKSSDVTDPARARQRAKDSLQLTIYAMAYQALTGQLPDAVQLHFLESGLVGRAEVDPKRLAKARAQIARAAAGIRGRDFRPTPQYLSCSYCAFREICPASAVK